jgi:hypothetical protein
MPKIKPVELPAVATDVLLLLHAPPPVPSPKTVVEPAHTLITPVMAAGSGLMMTGLTATQPSLVL